MNRPDMTKKQFDDACERRGFIKPEFGWGGYYELPCGIHASKLNGGPSRRGQLKYLIQTEEEFAKKKQEEKS
tara:strand:+ start:285 stop:500 length:216 start_codon:yes stop_codon:yes gene_type:complete